MDMDKQLPNHLKSLMKNSRQTKLERSRLEFGEFSQHVCELGDYLTKGKSSLSEFPPDLRLELEEVLDLVLHCCYCSSQFCHCYPKCGYMMALQGHVLKCKQARICRMCKSMMRFLKFHAGTCKPSCCLVRGCREIKEHNLKKSHRREHKRKERELRKQMQTMTITEEDGAKGKKRELRKQMMPALMTITEDGDIHLI